MAGAPILFLVLNWFFSLEYLLLGIVIFIDVIKIKRKGIRLQNLQVILYSLAGVLIPLRVIEEAIYFSLDRFYRGLLICTGYWIYYCLFTLTSYAWYYTNRLNIYTFNLFHLSLEKKLKITMIARWSALCITVLALIALIVIIAFVAKGLDERFEADDISIAYRLYQLVLILINFLSLLGVGSLLLRQLNKYFTEKPRKLIAYLYFNIIALVTGVLIISFFVASPGVFLDYLQ